MPWHCKPAIVFLFMARHKSFNFIFFRIQIDCYKIQCWIWKVNEVKKTSLVWPFECDVHLRQRWLPLGLLSHVRMIFVVSWIVIHSLILNIKNACSSPWFCYDAPYMFSILFLFAGICHSLPGSVTARDVQQHRTTWSCLSSRTTLGKILMIYFIFSMLLTKKIVLKNYKTGDGWWSNAQGNIVEKPPRYSLLLYSRALSSLKHLRVLTN